MPKPPPPVRPLAVSIIIGQLKVTVPVAAIIVLVLGASGVGVLLRESPGVATLPKASPAQRWTAGTGTMAALANAAVRGVLPPPDPRQKLAPCDSEVGEEEIEGACWLRLAVEKCNDRKAYPYKGKCYWRALRPEPLPREPTSGDGLPLGIADP